MSKVIKYSEFNESWRSIVAGLTMLFATSCDMVSVNGENKTDDFETEGTVIELTRIPLGDCCQYSIKVRDKDGNIIEIEKHAMAPFTDDETPAFCFFTSELKEGSEVRIVCTRDCKVYLK